MFLNGALHGLSRAEIRERMDEIVEFAGIGHYVDLPVRTYSAGMYMRLGFAVAAHVDADVLLLDEIFAVGDEEFQRKCFGRISSSSSAAARSCSSRTMPRRSSGSASARCCCARGGSTSTARRTRRSSATAALAEDAIRPSVAPA